MIRMMMHSVDWCRSRGCPQLPAGFRFHPTDEELIVHYLERKASSAPLPVSIIAEIDLYKFDPWELPSKAAFGEQEWYFFSPRDRKYPNGARPNRAATSGYWKATGTDKAIVASHGRHKVGVKKALVFYGGKPPRGVKTNWIMHEYRLTHNNNNNNNKPRPNKSCLRLDDWVLCRIYKKSNSGTLLPRTPPPLVEREKELSTETTMLPTTLPPLSSMANNNTFHNSKPSRSTRAYGPLGLENDDHDDFLDGILAAAEQKGDDGINNNFPLLGGGTSSHFWNHDQNGGSPVLSSSNSSKRFHCAAVPEENNSFLSFFA